MMMVAPLDGWKPKPSRFRSVQRPFQYFKPWGISMLGRYTQHLTRFCAPFSWRVETTRPTQADLVCQIRRRSDGRRLCSIPSHAYAISLRAFSARPEELLVNEKLVAFLIRKASGLSADKLRVRVIVESDSDAKPKPQLVSLADAIQMSIDLGNRDVIAISLDQEIPVLRIDHVNSFLYKQNKKAGAKSSNKKQQPEKEFRFNAGIEENDMKRKVETIAETLGKGTTCIVSVRCKGWMLKREPDLVKATAKRVMDSLQGVAEPMNEVRIVGDGTRAQFRLRPAK